MAYTSEVEIMNAALVKAGADPIIDPSDDNKRARLVSQRYPGLRDLLMRSHPWKFSTGYADLAALEPKPAEIYQYGAVFQLPADCARVFEVNLPSGSKWEEISGHLLACNESAVSIKYSKRVQDVSKFDDAFCEVLATLLGSEIVFALTQSAQRAADLKTDYEKILAQARTFSAQVGSVKRVISDDWLNARRSR